jgi:endonuclease/exonuclease/phosphatase family metal-dependent hydrolase
VLSAEVDVDGRGLRVLGTHLPHLQMGSLTQRGDLRALLPASGPAVLAGDMNMWRWCIRWMAPREWRNVVRGRTFPAHRPHSQIDHLLVTPDVEVVTAGVMPEAGSDHRAIRARLRV